MSTIDLRSDTVTKPSAAMMKAMLHAEVGDDVFGEDPTVNLLQQKAAALFGHEAGLFCPSGTMTNQIAIQVHTRPGDEVICHETSHVYNYEGGGIARNALSSCKLVRNTHATMHPDEVDALVNADNDWLARTSLVVAEDTSNRGGGKCYSLDQIKALSDYCRDRKLAFHLDGARAFNAIVKQGHDTKAYGSLFDSVSLCLSKGLGTPVGSVLLGSVPFIKEARRVRKVMGGGMRQAGFLAAAGLYAMEHNISRLADDHERAAHLAAGIASLPGIVHVIAPETNIVIFDVAANPGSQAWLKAMEASGLRAVAFGKNRIRMVTHLEIDDDAIERAISITRQVSAAMQA
jgi:threonine aldolase